MGRVNFERHIHFVYTKKFVAHYKKQTQDFKNKCDEIGKPFGYSGMNVFYCFFYQYWTFELAGKTRPPYERN